MKKLKLGELKRSDVFSRLPQMNYLPRWGVLLMDFFLCSLAFWFAVLAGCGLFDYIDAKHQAIGFGYQYLLVMAVQVLLSGCSTPIRVSFATRRLWT